MFEIREYCYRIDTKKPNVFAECLKKGAFREEVQKMEDLNAEELEHYQGQMTRRLDSYKDTWKAVIQEHMKYAKPNLINATALKGKVEYSGPLYVFAAFVKCGKQHYVIETQQPKAGTFVHSCITKFRNDEITPYRKAFKHHIVERRFRRDTSVFARWKEDEDATVKACLEHDLRYWKVPRFIRDPAELRLLEKCVKKNFLYLKNTHIQCCAGSTFPATSLNDFTTFSRRCCFTDRNLPQSTIDRLFI